MESIFHKLIELCLLIRFARLTGFRPPPEICYNCAQLYDSPNKVMARKRPIPETLFAGTVRNTLA